MDNSVNWVVIGWIIDLIFNGIVWFIIALCLLPLIDVSDKNPYCFHIDNTFWVISPV